MITTSAFMVLALQCPSSTLPAPLDLIVPNRIILKAPCHWRDRHSFASANAKPARVTQGGLKSRCRNVPILTGEVLVGVIIVEFWPLRGQVFA